MYELTLTTAHPLPLPFLSLLLALLERALSIVLFIDLGGYLLVL